MLPSQVRSCGARARKGSRAIRSPGSPAGERATNAKESTRSHEPPRPRSTSPSFLGDSIVDKVESRHILTLACTLSFVDRRPAVDCQLSIVNCQLPMANTFGKLFHISTWGESHGAGVWVGIDGCPPGIAVSAEEIKSDLD